MDCGRNLKGISVILRPNNTKKIKDVYRKLVLKFSNFE